MWFLGTVGVDPARQGAGLGRAVLRPGLETAERDGVPAFWRPPPRPTSASTNASASRPPPTSPCPVAARAGGARRGRPLRAHTLDAVANKSAPRSPAPVRSAHTFGHSAHTRDSPPSPW
ncbi:GNAT family N-acetyltransferase [Streptomyces sp. YIM 121038]|uniref:GNAT family N-acetyltransferase n=1 Tax=Streptomyces sp. YIM 121038 TaxID=2136401 RepID=UPI0031FE51EE